MQTKIDRQIALENESVELGAIRYRSEKPLPWREDTAGRKEETELRPGKRLLMDAIEPVARAIEEFIDKARTSGAGRRHSALPYLELIEPIKAAYIACRAAINAASHRDTLQNCMLHIALQIEDHLHYIRFQKDAPGLERVIARQLDKSTRNAKHRRAVITRAMAVAQIDKLKWTTSERLKLGGALLEIVENKTGLIQHVEQSRGANDTPLILQPTPACDKWLEEAHAACELLAPIMMPMIVKPRPWHTPFSGGYLTNVIRNFRMVKTFDRAYMDELYHVDMPAVYDALNAVQSVPWRINKAVLQVLREVWNAGSSIGGLPQRNDHNLPPRPAGIPKDAQLSSLEPHQQEAMKQWKAETAHAHDANSKLRSKRLAVAQKLWIAESMQDEEEIYFPHQLDWRGRVYPSVPFINPQADDSGKALLQFAVGKPLGDSGAFWLAIHIANLFGIDKVSFDERVQWVMDNEDAILDSASRPLDGARFWTTADSPYCALAASFEWLGYRIQGNDYVSHMAIALDGSCSGLQHFSAMLRDHIGGAQVNLVPSDKPADIYTAVAKVAQQTVDSELTDASAPWQAGKVIRKIAKQPCMTLCYGATLRGMQDQVKNALRKLDEEEKQPYLDGAGNYAASRYMGRIIRESIGKVVVAAKDAMDWLQEAARIAASEGLPVRWTTPVGLVVQQSYKELIGERHNVFFNGARVKLIVRVDGKKIDKRRQASGISPNFVHSLDAAHLMSTVNTLVANGVTSIACIHDSFGTHAADADVLHVAVRQAFVEQYREDVFKKFRDELVRHLPESLAVQLPPLPPKGELDLEAVMRSEYSFA